MHTASTLLLSFVNIILCGAIGWSAMCRLALMDRHTPLRVAFLYLGLFVGSVFSGLQWWIFGTMADWPDVVASVCILGLLLARVGAWRTDNPCRAGS